MLNSATFSIASLSGLPTKLSSGLAAIVLLSGCAFAPGSHMDRDKASEALDGRVEFHHITPELVAQIRTPRSSARINPELDQAKEDYDYTVGRGDVLMITVWNHPELTIPAGSMRNAEEAGNWVHNDGTIFYPYIGRVEVPGKRLTEIQELLTDRLADYLESPQVEVNVAAFRSQAGAMAFDKHANKGSQGGDVFVLDMGDPVRIEELARKLIRLMGRSLRDSDNPNGDIAIQYSGLRPGEKLYEELLIGDAVEKTDHPRIMTASEIDLPWQDTEALLQVFERHLTSFNIAELHALLRSAPLAFTPSDGISDLIWQRIGNRV